MIPSGSSGGTEGLLRLGDMSVLRVAHQSLEERELDLSLLNIVL